MTSTLLNSGTDHQVARGEEGTYTLTPRGSAEPALNRFQAVVREARRLESQGELVIVISHTSADVGAHLVDKIIVRRA